MAKYSAAATDAIFAALADPTRRAVVQRLGNGSASVSELAAAFPITLPSFMKHLRSLERSGLLRTRKTGRIRTCELDRDRLAVIDDWLTVQRRSWEDHATRLDNYLERRTEERV